MRSNRLPVVRLLGRRRPHGEAGASLAELMIVLVLASALAAFAVPTAGATIDAGRIGQAASVMASRFRLVRLEAVSQSRSIGLVFDLVGGRWTFRVCSDGNGNGLRRTEISSGTDACLDGPHDLQAMFPGVQVAVDPTLRGPGGEPPSPDPVRFGSSNLASFSSLGSCTAGTLFLRSPLGAQYAVRVAGATGRTRVLRYASATRSWIEV
jgi:type II secretory pathway pseudopilin PulG